MFNKNLYFQLKKLCVVIGFTAIGHILSVLLIPLLAQLNGADFASEVAIIDSSLFLLVSILGFGITLTTTRDVATKSDWKALAYKALNARFTLSFIIVIAATFLYSLSYIDLIVYLCLLIAPFVAMNLDFLLYGRSLPEKAALLSFARLTLPLLLFFILIYFFDTDSNSYILLSACSALFVGFLVFKILGLDFKPSFCIKSLYLYVASFSVGVASFFIMYQRYTFLPFYDASSEEVYLVSTLLKWYLAFIAIRRLLIQTFYTKLNTAVYYRAIETFILLIGVLLFLFINNYKVEITKFVFVQTELNATGYLVSFAYLILATSFFGTADSRLLLNGKDKFYIYACAASFSIWWVLYFNNYYQLDVLMRLAIAEFFLILFYRVGLSK